MLGFKTPNAINSESFNLFIQCWSKLESNDENQIISIISLDKLNSKRVAAKK